MGDRKIILTSKNADGLPSIEITKFRNMKTKTHGPYADVPEVPDHFFTDKIVYTKENPTDEWPIY